MTVPTLVALMGLIFLGVGVFSMATHAQRKRAKQRELEEAKAYLKARGPKNR